MDLNESITQYRLFDSSTKDKYEITQKGVRYNYHSENSGAYKRWMVVKNGGSGLAKVLYPSGSTISVVAFNMNEDNLAGATFATAEEALEAIKKHTENTLVPL